MNNAFNNNYSYYRTDIPAVKQFSNPPRENFSLKTNDLPGFFQKNIKKLIFHKRCSAKTNIARKKK
jgi:hypothetical protein